jgi:hypothetical protein
MSEEIEKLLAAAKGHPLGLTEKEEQRRSFAYGNTHIENDLITREMVDQQAELLEKNA